MITNQYCALCNSFYLIHLERNKHNNTKSTDAKSYSSFVVRYMQSIVHDNYVRQAFPPYCPTEFDELFIAFFIF